ncbi:MAG: glycosyltransferase family 4 protein [Cyanomargarita calcarea GSE-NOS-MK-12-04C]|jgi:glycosyltransferase involved in cell wall biosynthesis|uniref:Glycosyltransferase family 4 protein n=1 Tax=Cyanomargarita calcarea GSE-NOS-MK-12-04C TaxID=2839659 RepID=A0A951UV41_9CYAN|nr:glycosyltransferase family 4 protein [Cyanomargarita calcarea GSE-NOS-MK-12-04C]
MKVSLISTYDKANGSGTATYRLHQGLQKIGVVSQMLVQGKSTDDKTIAGPKTRLAQGIARARITFDALPLKFYPQRDNTTFSVQWFPDKVAQNIANFSPDVINLHWMNEGYVQIETIAKLRKPLVWTLHDMWAFTGGCHYNQECDRYTKSCGACPQLGSSKDGDLSRWVFQRKAKAWRNLNLTVVTPSLWLGNCARKSPLFQNYRIEVIPNGLDTAIYKPLSKQVARELLNLPQDKQLVVFGALQANSDSRKGLHLLQPALVNLSQSGLRDRLEIVIFGCNTPEVPPEFGFKSHYLGTLRDDLSLALIYSAADVFIAPSTQENLANTVMESLACGTPCVAFNIGGMPDMIEHQKNGYLAQPYKIEDLAKGIAWVLENPERHQKLAENARTKVEQEFTLEIQARRYKSLFDEIQSGQHKIYS